MREQPIPPGTAQNADHFATSSPFSALFTEVVCDVGVTPPQTAAAPPPIGRNCTTRGSDTPSEGFVSCKTPTATVVERRAPEGPQGLEGAGGSGGPEGLAAVSGRWRGPVQTNVARDFRRSFFETA